MKTTIKLIALSALTAMFSSCSGYLPKSAQNVPQVKKFNNASSNVIYSSDNYNRARGTVRYPVLSKATAQGGTGEPQIGLIPTMKTLAPDLNN